ncbi:ADP-ribose pyrophosphatase YjhB (NUDIX family) [Brevibacterium sanguinis]|uniref:ADP-ribose pyrophosphatase YjhB (NUDIX family) n=2 Tax=Brevibacterium TaxID=1696 RepID=A0A366IR23_9MICO|nr:MULTISPECIES: NUDIX hydrolase [Brevibacterium]RBP68163.1 ADP-ribose pyrophosphatase YjhB (NUDIX family) [Brevibacterium sanguinis]RBP74420.1 ADP-ribose pyrophosphatase YjhB (NUDIX family) [Brevibacterium celere]
MSTPESERPPERELRSGDGWVTTGDGRRFWGLEGAAGLMLLDPRRGVLLQHRALWSAQGGTWGFPGGARDIGEDAISAALRESHEEAGVPEAASDIEILATHVLDLEVWSYTTVIARTRRPVEAKVNDPESLEVRWVPIDELDDYPLHPGVASALPELLALLNDHS